MNDNKYKDRGLIKWAPFDSLTGIDNLLDEIRYRTNKKDKPSLSDDLIEDINNTLTSSINNNTEVLIKYFNDGYIKESYTLIKSVDLINKIIYTTSNEIINMSDVINII